jgi:hypothetical protein
MRRILIVFAVLTAVAFAQQPAPPKKKRNMVRDDGPQPRVVTPAATPGQPPSDAVVLFNGKDMTGWKTREGTPGKCGVANNEIHCKTGVGDIISEETFKDAQIHVEFAVPLMADQQGQRRGNSGVYIHSCYEVQILDSHNNPTYVNGMLGAVYGFAAPMVNAGRKPNEWQSYDLLFRAPRCDASGTMTKPGMLTVILNGVLVNDNIPIDKSGPGCRLHENICEPGPIRLQDHSGFPNAPETLMKFRNIWIRKLDQR